MKTLKEFIAESSELKGWIAFYNKKQVEIVKGKDADSLYAAKQFAIKHFNIPKSKQSLIAIEPAY